MPLILKLDELWTGDNVGNLQEAAVVEEIGLQ
jgi:hypothetical protein